MVGDAGNAILFIISLLVCVVLSAYGLCVAAHCFIVTVQGTVAGIDRIRWANELFFDWITQALTLLGIASIWLIPVGLLSRALRATWLVDHPTLRILIFAVPGLWLFFPMGLLSSLSSASRWQFVNAKVLGRMLRLTPQVFAFYVLTGVLVVAMAALGYVALITPAWYALPVAAVAGAALWLIYARLVGRLGWLIQELDDRPTASLKKKRTQGKKRPRKSRAVAVNDPWAVPEEEEEDPGTSEGPGYRVVEVQEKKAPRPAYMDPEPEPYDVAKEPVSHAPAKERLILNQAQVEREIELRTRTPPNPPPAFPLFSGVYSYPFYESTRTGWVWLAVCLFISGGMVRIVRDLFPF